LAIAIAVALNVYRSTTRYADAFDAMVDTSARIQALDHARADRTLLAVAFQTYQLGRGRAALNALVPLAANLTADFERVRTLTVAETSQQRQLERIDSQLGEFNRLLGEIKRLDSNAQPHTGQRPAQINAAAALLDTMRCQRRSKLSLFRRCRCPSFNELLVYRADMIAGCAGKLRSAWPGRFR
jgi:hypothetical protein